MEIEPEERDATDWLTDDEMMRHWEEVNKDDKEITVKRSDGGKLQVRMCEVHQNLWLHDHK